MDVNVAGSLWGRSVEAHALEHCDEDDRDWEESEDEDGVRKPLRLLQRHAGHDQLDDEDRQRLGAELPREALRTTVKGEGRWG